MKRNFVLVLLTLLCSVAMATNNKPMEENKNKLAVLWTSGDPEVAEKMAFMYTYNAKTQGWFDEVVLIIWGPSAKLTAENEMIQEYIKKMQEAGIKTEACLYCAKMYEVDEKLAELGVDVKGMGVPLSNYLKEGWKTLSL
ncbi:DsrE family protein [uncultured Draconibacterium sp.]|uniref:DsrE family protein n=1 Tax=uncultured Draconibacterium sp. TaxID=1573823 RepID=UPI0029C5FF26|nr:DsrE family protein [uncultured Draconibacterium sp.]